MIGVLIADDHAVVRQGLRTFLELQDDIAVLGDAGDGEEAVAQAARLQPDIVLLDVVMPLLDGVDAIPRIRAAAASARIIVLTSFSDDGKVLQAVSAGAAGYLLKDVSPQELVRAIHAVHDGGSLLHPTAASSLMGGLAAAAAAAPVLAPAARLTQREREVLGLIAHGLANKRIALELSVSEKTVKAHVSAILAKLEVSDRTQAALYAVREGLAAPRS